MCKVFLVSGIKPSTVDKVWAFARSIAKPMSRVNNDGLGYAAITNEGKLFGERWLNNSHAFKKEPVSDIKLCNNIGEAITGTLDKFEYNTFGELDTKNAVAITMHTRMATSPKGMQNTHPFVTEGVSLIHNGVIRNEKDFKLQLSTCDSESILISYLMNDVRQDPSGMAAAAKILEGYYACGVLTNDNEGPILDVFKSGHASLKVAYIDELETYVFSTDDSDIKDTCKELGFTMGQAFSIIAGKFLRIDAVTGKKKSVTDFKESDTYRHYNYSGYSGYTPPANTPALPAPAAARKTTADVYPFGKKKENTALTEAELAYYTSGQPTITKLSEREIQEEIMQSVMFGNRY